MAQKIFIGNLSFNASEEGLRELFGQYGNILSVNIITDRETGRPRGFGFIEMDNAEEAIAAVNGKELDGRALTVSGAREREQRSSSRNSQGERNYNNRNY